MRRTLPILGIFLVSTLSLFVSSAHVSAANVSVSEYCNVNMIFRATVPDSVQQGKNLTVSNLRIQPTGTDGSTVTSSVFTMTATNTSSSTYSQDWLYTIPSPTTGHSTYTRYYPNWSLNATGAVGSSVTIKLKKSVTVVQGHGTITCNFTKTLATIPIVAASPSPSPSPSQSPSTTPKPTTSTTTTPKPTTSAKPQSTTPTPLTSTTPTPTPTPSTTVAPDDESDEEEEDDDRSVTVVPLIIQVKDNSGNLVKGAVVTLDGSKNITTDSKGRVTFSNVLTGNHVVLVSYNGQKISQSINLRTQDVGRVIPIELPATPFLLNPLVIGGIVALVIGAGIILTLLALKRKKQQEQAPANPNASMKGIIAGATTADQPQPTTILPPAPESVHDARPVQMSPAPWDPAAVANQPQPQPQPQPQSQQEQLRQQQLQQLQQQQLLQQQQQAPVPASQPTQAPAAQASPVNPPTPQTPAAEPTQAPVPVENSRPPSPEVPPRVAPPAAAA